MSCIEHYFFVVEIIASIFNFKQISAGGLNIARIIFFIFLILFVISLFFHLLGQV
ncbi:MAG: DUF1328 family protein [Chlamydiota bacterium]|nr:DUF1328 family protein [Chlamydiota bacterium]